MDAKPFLLDPDVALDPDGAVLIARRVRQDTPRVTRAHVHPLGQLLGATAGLLTVETETGRWLVGPDQAIWAPPNSPHGVRSHGPFAGWSLYFAPAVCDRLPAQPCVLNVTPLLRALTERAAEWRPDARLDEVRTRLALVVVDEVAALRREAVSLPVPLDPRLRRVAAAMADDPADGRSLEAWADLAAMSPRSLTRRFTAGTGISLSSWRRRARLLKAREMLARGLPVTRTALEVGYDSPSAFSAAFRKACGCTPLDYAVRLRGDRA